MPCGHGKIINGIENSANGRHHPLSKRSLDHSNYKLSLKEHEVSALVLRNSEQRCIIFTLVTLGLDGPLSFLAPFFLPVQGSDQRYHLQSGANSDVGGLESSSPPPTLIFHVDLQKEQIMSERKGSVQSLLDQNSRPKASGESRKRNKRSKSIRNSSSTVADCLSPENSPGAVCDGSSAVCSDVLLTDVSKVNKPVKKNSRKKGKKKGKHSKRYTHRKASTDVETQCVEGVSGASVSEASGHSSPTCSREHSSETNLSENSSSSGLSIEEINMEKDDSEETTTGCINSIKTVMEGRSCDTEMKEYKVPLHQIFAEEDFSCTQSSTDEDSILMRRSSVTESPESPLSICDENTSDGHLKEKSSYVVASSISVDLHIAPMTDVSLDGWKSDISENCTDDIEAQAPIKHENALNSSAGGKVADCRINDTLFQNLKVDICEISSDGSNDIIDAQSGSERVQCSSQACSSNDFLPVVSGKRGRQARKMAKKLNGVGEFGGSKAHNWGGKDNNYRVWQKVQKNDAKCLPKKSDENSTLVNFPVRRSEARGLLGTPLASEQTNSKKFSSSTGLDETSMQSYLMKAASNVDSSDHPSKSIGGGSVDVMKTKPSSASKQINHSPRKGSHTCRTSITRHTIIPIQQKEGSGSPSQVNQNKLINIGLVSPSNTEIQSLLASSPDEIDCQHSEKLQKNQILMDEAKHPEDIGNSVYETTSVSKNNQTDSSLDEDDQISQLLKMRDDLHVIQSEVCSDSSSAKMIGDMQNVSSFVSDSKSKKCAKSESGCCQEEYIKKNSSIGPLSQKWVPLGSKDSVVFKDNQGNSSASAVVKIDSVGFTEGDSHTTNFSCPSRVDGEFTGVSSVTDHHVTCEVKDHVSCEVKDKCVSGFNTDLDAIVKAVNDSYKLQTASENFQLVNGSPVAEFERLLHFSSPVFGEVDCIRSCKVCPEEQLHCEVLCPHQIPCMSLESLWQWYEKPGSYGLEVKLGAYNNLKRLGHNHYGFRAYFVPYLSAVQLFGRSNSAVCRSKESLEVAETSEMHKSTSPSSLVSLPIFSKLLPRPHRDVDTFMSESPSSSKEKFCNQTATSTHFSDGELIFEYFESDQPQQRRPLSEKIKELLRGNQSSNCQIFGDPSHLECRKLHELHPASWYSVAWYPIYRIPDGNLRAAFLTYHSLGHFTHRKTSSKTPGGATSLVSPVVGLQSYNTKGECWFQPNQFKPQMVQTEGADISDPSGILKERLRTLEQTASAMARASVVKGGQRSVNRQSDYEFFISRKW